MKKEESILKQYAVPIVLLVFIISFYILGPANFLDKRIQHGHPFNILASDAAGEVSYVEGLKAEGGYRYTSPGHCIGNDDCVGFLPFLMQHLSAIFSYTAGIESYDANTFLSSFMLLLACLLFFLIIKQGNQHVALLSLPLMLFVFTPQFSIGFSWGYYDVTFAGVFLLAIGFILTQDYKKQWIPIAILLSAAFIAHVSEMIYSLAIIGLFSLMEWIKKKNHKEQLWFWVKTALLTGVLISYYAFIFSITYSSQGLIAERTQIQPYDATLANFEINRFSFLKFLPIILGSVGLLLSILLFKKKLKPAILVAWIMFFLSFNIFNFSFIRMTQIRYFWPIYLSIFIGLTIYTILQFINLKQIKIIAPLAIILIIGTAWMQYGPAAQNGLFYPTTWDALKFIRENLPDDATVHYLYGDGYSQNAMLWNGLRTAFLVRQENYFENLQQGKLTKFFSARLVSPNDVHFAYWKDNGELGYYEYEAEKEWLSSTRNICTVDYLMFDLISQQQVLGQYNQLIAQQLTQNGDFQILHQNDGAIVLQNINFNEECFAEAQLQ